MIYISHRGNITGPNSSRENHPDYLKEAIKKGYQVELDVWFQNKKFYLGHDTPEYEINKSFLSNSKFWCHAKNVEAINELTSQGNLIHCFFHDTDACTLTSRGWIWAYPGTHLLGKKMIAVMPERIYSRSEEHMLLVAGGLCSDYVEDFQKSLKL